LGEAVDQASGRAVDEVLCVFFRGPRSYTTEDTVEVQGHGGSAVARRLLELALELGCRLAQPGEFTLRAFLGGRLDLAQAEAVAELVAARSATEAGLALAGLQGGLGRRLEPVRRELVRAAAALEAVLDFPDDMTELGLSELEPSLGAAATGLGAVLEERARRRVFREGTSVVICGRPNVGKSSIFNAMLGRNRAMVSPQAGTTRDWLEETLLLGGVAVRLVDTAGLGDGGGELGRLGRDTARDLLTRADFCLVVLDGSQPLKQEDGDVLRETQERPRLVVVNKDDLGAAWEPKASGAIRVSARNGAGLEGLMEVLGRCLSGDQPEPAMGEVVASARQAQALAQALTAVQHAQEALLPSETAVELAAVNLAAALGFLGEVDGQGAPEEVIEAVFREFCIGK
jgi:tRNA modification GTPase